VGDLVVLRDQPDGTADHAKDRPARARDVLFVLPHMGPGGAQRVISLVANAWVRQGKRVAILTWNEGREDTHDLDPGVERFDLAAFSQSLNIGLARRSFWSLLEGGRSIERRLRPIWRSRPPRTIKDLQRDLRAGKQKIEQRLRPLSKERSAGSPQRPSFIDESPEDTAQEDRSRSERRQRRDRRRRKKQALTFRLAVSILRRLQRGGRGPWAGTGAAALRSFLSRRALGHRIVFFREALAALNAPVVVSLLTRTNLYVLSAAERGGFRVVVSERNDPDLQQLDQKLVLLREVLYRNADVVTSNSAGVLMKLEPFVPAEKLMVLPNPVVVPKVVQTDTPRGLRFVTVARLVHQKGIDLLLDAFARIARELPDWNLDIVGDGPMHQELIDHAKTLGIADRVTFHGYVAAPMTILRSGRVFVLPSRFEGMPNALLEAMACGLAPIVTDASPGPLESVKHEITGLVVPTENAEAIAAAMLRLASDQELVKRLALQARAYINEHDWMTVEPQWLHVLGMETRGAEVESAQVLGESMLG